MPQEQQPPQEPQEQEPQEEDPQEQELNEEAVSLSFLCCKQMLSTAAAAISVFVLKLGPRCQMNPCNMLYVQQTELDNLQGFVLTMNE